MIPIELYNNTEYNQLRIGYLILFSSLINDHLIDEDINDYVDIIIAIERSCYLHSIEIAEYELLPPEFTNIQFEQLYRTRIVRIAKNLISIRKSEMTIQ